MSNAVTVGPMDDDAEGRLPITTSRFGAPSPINDCVMKFSQIMRDFDEGFVKIPVHQREPGAWDHRKQLEYIRRQLQADRNASPPGFFATYELVDHNNPPNAVSATYLNDGYQRLNTLLTLRAQPSAFDLDVASVNKLLNQHISIQHRHYFSHEEAMRDFQLINNGTHLTSHELCTGYLQYMPDYDSRWEPLLEKVQRSVERSEIRLGIKMRQGKTARKRDHTRRRHTWSVFYRFLTNDTSVAPYADVGATEVQSFIDSGKVIEILLRDRLLITPDPEKMVAQFEDLVDRETATLIEHVREVLEPGATLASVTHRWLLDLAVWRRTNNRPVALHLQFIDTLLTRTGGRGQWIQDGYDPVTLRYAFLGFLPKLAEMAGLPGFYEMKRDKELRLLQPGYDHSHVEPFATHGNGPTVAEPAGPNRARGAQPMDDCGDDEDD